MSSKISKMSKLSLLTLSPLLLALTTGCASFKLKEHAARLHRGLEHDWSGDAELRMKAPDNVGLNITSFENSRGGTLPLWSTDMVKKLAGRGYTLERQTAVKSANGVEGTRFDFSYTPRGSETAQEKFYTAVLFVTDEWQVVVQMAGDKTLEGDHASDVEKILREIKVSGCKVGSKVCKAGQPGSLSAPGVGEPSKPTTKPNGPGPDAEPEATAIEPAAVD